MAKRFEIQRAYVGERVETPDDMMDVMEYLSNETSHVHGNYGVAAVLINKRTRQIVSVGVNSVIKSFHLSGVDFHDGAFTDGHAEMNAIRAYLKARKYAEREVRDGTMSQSALNTKYNPDNLELWCNLQCCRMCEGAVYRTGIQTRWVAKDPIVLSIDEVYAGSVNRAKRAKLNGLIRQADGELDGAYAGCSFDNARYHDRMEKPFNDTVVQVRNTKEDRENVRRERLKGKGADITPINLGKWLAEGDGRGEKIVDYIRERVPDIDDYVRLNVSGPDDSELHRLVAKRAVHSEARGDHLDACAAVDPHGTIWCVVGDRTLTDDPLRTPFMRAMGRLESILDILPAEYQSRLPRPGEFVFVTVREPDGMEGGRLSNVYANKIRFMQPDRHEGILTSGQLKRWGDFYLVRRTLEKIPEQALLARPQFEKLISSVRSEGHVATVEQGRNGNGVQARGK